MSSKKNLQDSVLARLKNIANDNHKITQWRAFLRKNRLAVQDPTFAEVVERIRRYFSDMDIIP